MYGDDDEPSGSGLGGLAWFKLGEWSEQSSRSRWALMDSLTGRSPVARAAYNDLVNQYNTLAQTNDQLRASIATGNRWLREWKEKFDALKAYADQQATQMLEVKEESIEQGQKIIQLFKWWQEMELLCSNLEEAYRQRAGEAPPDWVYETD